METIGQLLEFALNRNGFQQTLHEFMKINGVSPEDLALAAEKLSDHTGDDPFTDAMELQNILDNPPKNSPAQLPPGFDGTDY